MQNLTIINDLELPLKLIEATDKAVQEGNAKNRNELIIRALKRELQIIKREKIDAAFANMDEDTEYQIQAASILTEFAQSDWESWQLGATE